MEIIKSNVDELKKLKPMKVLLLKFKVLLTTFFVGHYCGFCTRALEDPRAWLQYRVSCCGCADWQYGTWLLSRWYIVRVNILTIKVLTGTSHSSPVILSCTIWGLKKFQSCIELLQCNKGTFHANSREDKNIYVLTKGDNNRVDDRGLYPQGVKWLHKE